jgi:hypothetical protein
LQHLPNIITKQTTLGTKNIPAGATTGSETETTIEHFESNKASGIDNLLHIYSMVKSPS